MQKNRYLKALQIPLHSLHERGTLKNR